MGGQEVGPEWVLSSFTSPSHGTQDHINELVAVTGELELLRQAHDSRAARDIEQSVQAKEAVQNLDEWPRKVWIARKYGYSFPEIASFLGMSEAQVKLRFRYALARLREKLGL